MAESRSMPKKTVSASEIQVSELLMCPICQSVCKDPRILSCGHMVCSECISGWIKVKGGELWCPECNEQRQLPQGGAQSLPGGFRLNNACSLLREKMDLLAADSGKCQRHPGMDLGLICKECRQAVCEMCSLEDHHADHFCASPTSLMKQVLEAKERRARSGLSRVSQLQQELDKNMEDGKDVIKDFRERFELACAQLSQQLESVYKDKADLLAAQEREIRASVDGIRSLHQVLQEEEHVDIQMAVSQLELLPEDDKFIPKASSLLEVKMMTGFMDNLYSINGETKCGRIVSCGPPSPSNCEIKVASKNLLAKEEIQIHLILRDEQGNIVISEQCDVISVDILSPNSAKVASRVQKEENGQFLISFTPLSVGWYEITTKVHHKAIDRRPLRLAIKPHGREVGKIVGSPSFSWPHDVLKLDSNLIVVDKVVNAVDKDGKVIQAFPNRDWYFYPYSVAYHNQVFYVTAMKGQAVIMYNPNGEEIRRFGNGHLKKPTGIALDGDGWIYVADSQLSKILVFSEDGEFQRIIETKTGLKNPWFIKLNPKGELVVADCRNKRIQVLNVNSDKEVMSIYVKHQGQPMLCRGVDVDRNGNIYVAARIDGSGSQFECIMVYGPNGAFIGSFAESPSKKGLEMVRGIHLAVEGDMEVLYVVDGENRFIRIYEL